MSSIGATGAGAAAFARGVRVATFFGSTAAFSALTGATFEPLFARVFLTGCSAGDAETSEVALLAAAFGARGLRVYFSAGATANASVVALVSVIVSSAIRVLLCQAQKRVLCHYVKSIRRYTHRPEISP
jgi:hypothetical protein